MSKILIVGFDSERTLQLANQLKGHTTTVLSFAWSEDRSEVAVDDFITEIKVPVEPHILAKYRIYKKGIAKNNHDISFHLLAQYLKTFKKKAKDLEEIIQKIETKEERWFELSAKIES
jgi:hypothetical protein